ncbi:MAG: hypothetical protein JRI59_09055 [Deltaproteobacteria bacterium]|nr:hypothetical protein [Deltaproteobacteria bacterium]
MRPGRPVWCGLLLATALLLMGAAPDQPFFYDHTFAPGTEPDGFDGLRWGTDSATAVSGKNLMPVTQIGLSTYYRKDPAGLKFGLARPQEVIYEFWKGKFAGVVIRTKGFSNYRFLREYCFRRFGPGSRTPAGEKMDVQDFFWNGYQTRVRLTYNERYQLGELRLTSIKMENQRAAFHRLKDKKPESLPGAAGKAR